MEENKITYEIVKATESHLGSRGVEFFSRMLSEHGEISPVFMENGVPHSVHFSEGMSLRNFLRKLEYCREWTTDDFDNLWIEVVAKILEVDI